MVMSRSKVSTTSSQTSISSLLLRYLCGRKDRSPVPSGLRKEGHLLAHSTHKPTRGLALGVVGSGDSELCHQPLGLTPHSCPCFSSLRNKLDRLMGCKWIYIFLKRHFCVKYLRILAKVTWEWSITMKLSTYFISVFIVIASFNLNCFERGLNLYNK